MNMFYKHHDAIRRTRGHGFVDYTITHRMPKILSDIKDEMQTPEKLEAAQAMLQSIIAGSQIDMKVFACPTTYWERYLDGLSELTWDDLPFFDLEYHIYQRLNSIAGYFDAEVDVFRPIRQKALVEALTPLESGIEEILKVSDTELLKAAIRCSLFANEADYSQLVTSRGNSELWQDRVLLDESDDFISHLKQNIQDSDEIHLIADNAGPELCWDLVMIDVLLRFFSNVRIVIHVKPWPMFVSDALAPDVKETLNHFLSSHVSEGMRSIGQRLTHAIERDRLRVQAETDWGEPRHFNGLNTHLADTLSHSISVISKGDLNYRRFVQDLQWQPDTPVEMATSGVPFEALALRVLKSDAVVGIKPSLAEKAASEFSDWRTRGYFAVVQSL